MQGWLWIFFQFSSHLVNRLNEALEGIHTCITPEVNTLLGKPFSLDKVHRALKSMHPYKSPGPDGFSAFFYQNFWPTVGEKTTDFVLRILNTGIMPESLNHTNIILIPKKEKPKSLHDFGPISLCNVLYKLVFEGDSQPSKIHSPFYHLHQSKCLCSWKIDL